MATSSNIVISGLTAAGKTTHALLLAEALGFTYVSSSQILASLAGYTVDSSKESWWDKLGGTLTAARHSGALDRKLDEEMCRLASEAREQIFDAWALPWTSLAPMLRIWLASTPEARTIKCCVSHLPAELPLTRCREIIDEKDDYSREMFDRLYHFDLFADHAVFDVIVDSTSLVTEPTESAAAIGIGYLDPVLRNLSRWWLAMQSDQTRAEEHRDSFWQSVSALPTGVVARLPAGLEPVG
jgi:cytidylate kinase